MTWTIWMHVHAIIGACWVGIPVLEMTIVCLAISKSLVTPLWYRLMIGLNAPTNWTGESIWEYWVLRLIIRLSRTNPMAHRCHPKWTRRDRGTQNGRVHCILGVLVLKWKPGGHWGLICSMFKLILQKNQNHKKSLLACLRSAEAIEVVKPTLMITARDERDITYWRC